MASDLPFCTEVEIRGGFKEVFLNKSLGVQLKLKYDILIIKHTQHNSATGTARHSGSSRRSRASNMLVLMRLQQENSVK
jgi:hypothetical protein